MSDLSARVRAVCDLNVGLAREESGRHEYDGVAQDLSPAGVAAGLAAVSAAREAGPELEDPHDETHLRAFEDLQQVAYGELELHRRSPMHLLDSLDLSCYDKEYAPAAEREDARNRHLAAWPEAIGRALTSLDQVSAPVAESLLSAARGLAAGIPAGAPAEAREAALAAHEKLVAHLGRAAESGPPDAALGAGALAKLLGTGEALAVDLEDLARRADAERDRLMERLAASTAKIDPSKAPLDLARELVKDHPGAGDVLEVARRGVEEALAFTREKDLVPYHDGTCLVRQTPESLRFAVAMISINAPAEPDAPSQYFITPPEESWSEAEAEEWLEMFSATTLPAINVHEVAPGHFSHFQAVRRAKGDVRRTLFSNVFIEGWAHYAEELCVEEGFAGGDPRFEIGVWLEALVRVTRLASAIGVHTGGWTVEDAARRFEADTHLAGPAALSEARRATFDPTYGRYTWGKLEIQRTREEARATWGSSFTLKRFHTALMDLGSPPLGLLSTAIIRG
ncbi:MAG: DUF885 domain-containing protein [Streptosporangiales bacterium]|nr:DUF885 domain-containing protein [Streptosporangiales bacterium]